MSSSHSIALTPAGSDGHGIEPTHDGTHIHTTSPILLLSVYGILVILTILTVAVTLGPDLGDLNVWVALGIAVVKASIVALYFMHLRWDSPFNGAILIFAFIFVSIFIGVSVLDSHNYQTYFTIPRP
jgi:cytochrome c oxidase subunit IV